MNYPTAPPPADETYVAVVLETLISINGSKALPVKDVTVQGITFRDAADITMNPWGVPSGGDWGLYRGGAIFIEGAEDVTIQHNTLTRLDGNGVFVSGAPSSVCAPASNRLLCLCVPLPSLHPLRVRIGEQRRPTRRLHPQRKSDGQRV